MSSAPATAITGPVQVNVLKQIIGSKERAFVDPPLFNIGIGPTKVSSVRWTNGTDVPAKLWFPNGDQLFDPPFGGFSNPIDIPAGGLTLQVKNSPNPGNYHYHVFCAGDIMDCAQGKSEPGASCP